MKHKKFYAVLFLMMYIATMAFGGATPVSSRANKSAKVTTDELASILSTGVLKVGSDTTYPPFESINTTTSNPEGFDVDLASYIAYYLSPTHNVTVDFMTSAWEPIIQNLNNNQFNVIISAMTITPARAQQVDFTRWYYQSYQAILVPSDNPKNIQKPADLNKTGVRVGVQAGTTEDFYAGNYTTADIHRYTSIDLAIVAMGVDDVDCVLGDYAVVALNAQKTTNKVVATYAPEYFGIAVSKGQPNLLNKLNDILNGLLGTNLDSPSYNANYTSMYNNWFGVDAPSNKASSTPGFEYTPVLFVAAAIPFIRKKRAHK